MFIGHFAPALAAAAATPRAPRLGTLFFAAQAVDWAFFALVIAGVEQVRIVPGITAMNPLDFHDYPYTHSLLGSAIFASVFGALVWAIMRDRLTGAIAGMVVLSHWVLDWLVHRPDLTLAGGAPFLGLGLWNVPLVEIPLELAVTFGALAFYLMRRRGPWPPALALGAALLVMQAINWFGPPPQSAGTDFALTGLAAFAILTVLAWWLGKSRPVRHAGLAGRGAPG